jgi:hypothetical protein
MGLLGTVLNGSLTYASMLYAVFIGCFLPCLRGSAPHTQAQQFRAAAPLDVESFADERDDNGGGGGCCCIGGSGGSSSSSSSTNAGAPDTTKPRLFEPALDLWFWLTVLALPTSVLVSYVQYHSLFTRSVLFCWMVLPAVTLYVARRWFVRARTAFHASASHPLSIGLFHPNCEQGGGGERVLWCLVHHLATNIPALSSAHFYVYTQRPLRVSADRESQRTTSHIELLQSVRQTFGINLLTPDTRERLHFVWLNSTGWLDSARYPRLTLLLQALGSVIPAFEALSRHNPHVLIDTCGYPFIYPVFALLGGARTVCYTHYPIISANMLWAAGAGAGAGAPTATTTAAPPLPRAGLLKRVYYQCFAQYYALTGRCVDTVMVNSQWTSNQLQAVWGPCTGQFTSSLVLPARPL